MRKNGSLSFLLSDHLGSTSITTDAAGTKTSELRYSPWGEVRFSSSANPGLPTDYTFTGQYSYMDDPTTSGVSEGFGLMFYNARWYDPALGRFAQADTIVPGGFQGLDRYAYVDNNPIRYTDPTGHFTDKQLNKWFGKDNKSWRDFFDEAWQSILELAEFGDLVTVGETQAVFVESCGMLVGWNIDERFTDSPITAVADLASRTGELGLYRSANAPSEGGPTQNSGVIAPGEFTSPENSLFNVSSG